MKLGIFLLVSWLIIIGCGEEKSPDQPDQRNDGGGLKEDSSVIKEEPSPKQDRELPPKGEGKLGDPCKANNECKGGLCLQNKDWKDGYCSKDCSKKGHYDCPEGWTINMCIDYTTNGNKFHVCVKGCKTKEDCREHYKCEQAPGVDRSVCVPESF
jgi:hypothetical protein